MEEHIARFPELDSDVSEFEFDIDLDGQISKPTNLMFYGETSYITSFTWDKPQGARTFILSLYDSTQTLIHSETLSSGGIYLATPYNKFIRKLTSSGTYIFTVKAIATEQNLFINNNKVVLYTVDSEIESFNFTYTSGTALSAPQNIQLSNKYIDHKIQWKSSVGAKGYEIRIKDENGDILYTGYADVQYDDGICYCYTERFISKLTSSGKYKISVVSLGSPNIGRINILKSHDSDVSEFEFLYNLDTKEITNVT